MNNRLNYLVIGSIFRSMDFFKNNLGNIFKKYDLIGTEFGILEAIHKLGPQPIQVLSKRILLTSGGMSYTKKQLIKKELIYEKICKEDKRICFVHLTDKGEKLISEVLKEHDIYLNKLLSNLNEEEKKIIFRLLKKIY